MFDCVSFYHVRCRIVPQPCSGPHVENLRIKLDSTCPIFFADLADAITDTRLIISKDLFIVLPKIREVRNWRKLIRISNPSRTGV